MPFYWSQIGKSCRFTVGLDVCRDPGYFVHYWETWGYYASYSPLMAARNQEINRSQFVELPANWTFCVKRSPDM